MFECLLEARGLTKAYGAVRANEGVDLVLRSGEVHGLLGENGAGKTTLLHMLAGLERPDAGSVTIREDTSVGLVHQHFSLCASMTVVENIALGARGRSLRRVRRRELAADIIRVAASYDLHVDPWAPVAELSVGERQRAEIVKCLLSHPRILLLDEPTAVLAPGEIGQLFDMLRRLADSGCAVLLVTHKLEELLSVTTSITVLRDGRVVGEGLETAATDMRTLARLMVGREVTLRSAALGLTATDGVDTATDIPVAFNRAPVVLAARDLSYLAPGSTRNVEGVSFEVRAGEVVGIAGVEGNGQATVVELLSGVLTPSAGSVSVGGEDVTAADPAGRYRAGLAVVPEDRDSHAAIGAMTVAENLSFRVVGQAPYSRRGLIRTGELERRATALIQEFGIKAAGSAAPMGTLSGGNRQRVVLARELAENPKVLIAGQPTRGLDVGGIEDVTAKLVQAAAQGTGILLVSSELDELKSLAHRILVMHRGQIVGEVARSDFDDDRIGELMAGIG